MHLLLRETACNFHHRAYSILNRALGFRQNFCTYFECYALIYEKFDRVKRHALCKHAVGRECGSD